MTIPNTRITPHPTPGGPLHHYLPDLISEAPDLSLRGWLPGDTEGASGGRREGPGHYQGDLEKTLNANGPHVQLVTPQESLNPPP